MDKEAIEQQLKIYTEGLHESDGNRILSVFHPEARIAGYLQGELMELGRESLAEITGHQVPSAKDSSEERVCEILSLEISGQTAIARLKTRFMGFDFVDSLSLIQVDQKWLIYNKLFQVV